MIKVACILPSRIGDIVFALPAISSIKKSISNAHITFFVDTRYKALLELNLYINQLVEYDFRKLKNPLEIIKAYFFFKKFSFDIVFDMQGYLKSSLLALAFSAKYKFGTSPSPKEPAYLFSKFVYSYKDLESIHRVDRHLVSLEKIFHKYLKIPFKKVIEFPYVFSSHEKKKYQAKLDFYLKKDSQNTNNYFLLFLGGGWISRRWGYKNYFELSRKLQKELNLIPIVVGGAPSGSPESEEYYKFFKLAKTHNLKLINFYGKLSLREFIFLCKYHKNYNIKFFIGNDAGATHIAWSSGVYTFEILGPTSPKVVKPYINGDYFYKALSCSPCRNRNCKDVKCMKSIKVKEVFDKLISFMKTNF